jgi:antitoxin (DNA-binding transcriptional repressor) of toxin-antitoxin stability system
MQTISVEEAQRRLSTLLDSLRPGEEVVLTRDNQAIARIVAALVPSPEPRRPGSAVGELVILKEDEEHLDDFREYLK